MKRDLSTFLCAMKVSDKQIAPGLQALAQRLRSAPNAYSSLGYRARALTHTAALA